MNRQTRISRMLEIGTKSRFVSYLLVIMLLATGCTGLGTGALPDTGRQAWVEYPYEGSILPMGQVMLVVYAADPAGISYIHIKVNGQSLPAYAASPMTSDGSTRLVRIDYAWQPPAEGEYRVDATGVNSAGASGGSGSTRFCIVTCAPIPVLMPHSTDTPTPAPGDTPSPAPGDTPTPLPFITLPPNVTVTSSPMLTLTPYTSAGVTVEFFADPPYVNAGNCSTMHWDVSGTDKVYLNGSSVYFRGMEQRCPCQTETNTLRVIKPDGTSQDYPVRIDVYGSCSAPVTDTPQPPPPPSDTSGPMFISGNLFWDDCKFFGVAEFTDPSGVGWAEFHYNLNNQGWAWILMNQSGNGWKSQVGVDVMSGIGTPIGSLQYKFRSLDSLNNESWSGVSEYNYMSCSG